MNKKKVLVEVEVIAEAAEVVTVEVAVVVEAEVVPLEIDPKGKGSQ